LTYTVTGLPGTATLTAGAVYGTATLNWAAPVAGTYTVTVTATDGGNGVPANRLSGSQTFTLVVRATNAAPVVAGVADRTVAEGATLTVALSATDADGDAVTWSGTDLPEGATIDPQTGVFRWTPNFDQGGHHVITVRAGDGSAGGTTSFAVDVANVNR